MKIILKIIILVFCTITYANSWQKPIETKYLFSLNDYIPGEYINHNDHNMKNMDHYGHGPIQSPSGFMGGHSHKAGHLMFSYHLMYMEMKGKLLKGSKGINLSDATSYMMLPKEMTMTTHMFGIMYTPVDKFIVALMMPYTLKRMVMQSRMMPMTLTTQETDGIGDAKISMGYTIFKNKIHYFHGDMGFGLPTGSINKTDPTTGKHYGYQLQLGSGSYELLPAITYGGNSYGFAWAFQMKGTFRINENSNKYKLGSRYEISTWGSYKFFNWLSSSVRLNFDVQENIKGQDLNQPSPSMMPGHDPNAYGYTRFDGLLGLNFYPPTGTFKSKIAMEGGIPMYQHMEGIKRAVSLILSVEASIGYSF
ncbi:MAG: hypothetical protein OEV44_00540 [Spirochaetota bacterium]|nr:hypothetical protein [Spirochaetota bacterium]